MSKPAKIRIYSGGVCEQIVFPVSDRAARANKLNMPRPRFRDREERIAHREAVALKKLVRLVNANFAPGDLFVTLTCDDNHIVHTFDEARAELRRYIRRLRRRYPNAVIVATIGRCDTTGRIHFHLIIKGIPEEVIRGEWRCGEVDDVDPLWEHCYYDGKDHGADYTGLARYLFAQWTEEQSGHHHYYVSRTARQPEHESPTLCKREYTLAKPPYMRHYRLIDAYADRFGRLFFTYLWAPMTEPENLD